MLLQSNCVILCNARSVSMVSAGSGQPVSILGLLLALLKTTESSNIFYAVLKIILGQDAAGAEVTQQAPLHSSRS